MKKVNQLVIISLCLTLPSLSPEACAEKDGGDEGKNYYQPKKIKVFSEHSEQCSSSLTKFVPYMFFADNEEANAEEFKHGATFHETTLCLQDIITYLSSWSAF